MFDDNRNNRLNTNTHNFYCLIYYVRLSSIVYSMIELFDICQGTIETLKHYVFFNKWHDYRDYNDKPSAKADSYF